MPESKQKKVQTTLKTITKKFRKMNTGTELGVAMGNAKLGNNTLIINMGTATDCPSAALGMCNAIKQGATCYALKPEIQYKEHTTNYRHKQFSYWRNNTATAIANDLIKKIASRNGSPIKYVRFNEAGDFWDQNDIKKLSTVAKKLKNFNIVTYGYTARRDLDFKDVNFLVKGSGHSKGNNGMTTIIETDASIPEGFRECPGSCKTCNLCMVDKKFNIAFRKH